MPSLDPVHRLDDIINSIARITDYVAKAGGASALLRVEDELHDAVERRLLMISEAAVKLGAAVEIHEPRFPWKDIRGLGNSLRHTYDQMDDDVIKDILENDLVPPALACVSRKAIFSGDQLGSS